MKEYILRFTFIMLVSTFFLMGCDAANNKEEVTSSEVTVAPDTKEIDVTEDTEDSNSADIEDSTAKDTEEDAAEVVAEEEIVPVVDVNYDPDFELILEAEEAEFTGKVEVQSTKQGFTGTGYLTGIESDADTITFSVTVPGTGAYDLNFISAGNTGHKENNILVDGINIGLSIVDGSEFTDAIMKRVYLSAGDHVIKVTKSWGWILLDALTVTASAPADTSIFETSADLVDAKATDRTKKLMQYLTDMYGDFVISGQYGDRGIEGSEFKAIQTASGEYPAMLGLDLIEYTPSRVANGSAGKDVEYAIKFDEEGGIVTFCWHWNAPEPYLIDSADIPWWKGFYTEGTNIKLKKIMDGEDKEGYDLLIRDIDAIAVQLKKLQEADVPILWRPLHEASGGWFWWGAAGPEAYIELYQLLFDRLTNYHNIHNLIWVWNGQNKDWYPGDKYVDIVGTDVYPGEKVYSSQSTKFNELVDWNGDSNKIVAMTENGCMFDPELAVRDNAMWSYFGTWEGEFLTLNGTYTLSQKYTETDMLKKVYTSDKVITLDELPDLKTYGN